MHKYQLLRLRAEELRTVLEEYAQKDDDVADFLQRWMPWYDRVQRREIRLPCYEYRLGIYFANPDLSPLAESMGLRQHHIHCQVQKLILVKQCWIGYRALYSFQP